MEAAIGSGFKTLLTEATIAAYYLTGADFPGRLTRSGDSMHFTRIASSLLLVATITACGGTKEAPADSVAAAPEMAAAPTLASFAGTWQLSATLAGVEKPVASTLTSTPDGASWTISLEGRPNVAITASMSGDSLVAVTAEYESVLRKGVMVVTRTASVLKDGALVGNMTATYKTPTGEEVVAGTISGTRAP